MNEIHHIHLEPLIKRALEEDWGFGDWTTEICVPKEAMAVGKIISRGEAMVAGMGVAKEVFTLVDPTLAISLLASDGESVGANAVLLEVRGNARSILKAERVALNFLARMTGIATTTRRFVHELEGLKTQLLDTRKTTPGLRILEKAAAVIGGARNHRLCLCDGVIVKENHIRAAGGIKPALDRLHESLPPTLKIEVECTNLQEVQEALEAGADLIMLDNMPISEMRVATHMGRGRVLWEASGNVTLSNIRKIAETGVDFVSTGSVFHSAPWADLSLLFAEENT